MCNIKQRWNEDKCKCECREELSDKQSCDKGFIWNPSNYNCCCDKSCNIREYLDYQNCKCRNKILGELIEECSENIDENEMICNETVNGSLGDYNCGPCTLYIVLSVVFLVASVLISSIFIYFYWYLKESNDQLYLEKDTVCIRFNPNTQTTIY